MPRLVTTLLLVLQFHPVVGAVACVEQSLATHRRCEMTALGEGGNSGSGTPNDAPAPPVPGAACPLGQLCVVGPVMILPPSPTASLSGAEAGSLPPDAAETLPAIDRTAPPVPPPNR